MQRISSRILLILVLLFTGRMSLPAGNPPTSRAKHAMVVSAHELASKAGIEIMKKGGNAIDAAVAVGFALAVVFPQAGNIGGGGFMVIRTREGREAAIDFREKAPYGAYRTMYIDSAGAVTDRSVNGHRSCGVPGTVAGLLEALSLYGTMHLADVIQPAIDLAEKGFVVDSRLAQDLENYRDLLMPYPSTVKVFSRGDGFCREGDTLRLPDLASTLRRIQLGGAEGFYRGATARLITEEMRRGAGLITEEDLRNYRVIPRTPLRGSYRGYTIISMPLPTSGGVCLVGMLNILEQYDLASMGFHSSRSVHIIAEAMKRVYADRAEFMGDPDFVRAPEAALLAKDYARRRAQEIDTLKATPSSSVFSGKYLLKDQDHTTHYVVADPSGAVVSTTYTLNDLFGSKVIVEGAGFFLNDEMDDFSVKPGVPNNYGLIGGSANAIEGDKRPLSSMTPVIVLKQDKPYFVLGARGGSRIITTVLEAIVNVVDYGMDAQEAVLAKRFHHQWLPDEIQYEKFCLPEDVLANLRAKGHVLRETGSATGEIEALMIDSGWIEGAPDPREGGVAVGY